MIIEFSIENFLSFKEKTTLSMIENRSTAKEHEPFYDPAHTRTIRQKPKLNILPISAIYGYNATGKSNIIKAFKMLKKAVTETQIPKKISENNHFKFNNTPNNTASILAIEFYEEKLNKTFIYFICFNRDTILREELILKQGNRNQFKKIFKREYKSIEKNTEEMFTKYEFLHSEPNENFNIIDNKYDTILFAKELSIVKGGKLIFLDDNRKTNNIPIDRSILSYDFYKNQKKRNINLFDVKNFFEKIVIIDSEEIQYDKKFLKNSNDTLFSKVSQFELGIDKIDLNNRGEKVTKEKLDMAKDVDEYKFLDTSINLSKDSKKIGEILDNNNDDIILFATPKFALKYVKGEFLYYDVIYTMKDVSFTGDEVSNGTKQLIEYAKLVETPPEKNYIYIIDEIETNLHRNLLKALVSNFIENNNNVYEKSKGKNLGSQLIFTTHETSLMSNDDIIDDIVGKHSLLRLDEIFHVLKDNNLSSKIMNFSYYDGIENVAKALESAYAGDYIEIINKPKLKVKNNE